MPTARGSRRPSGVALDAVVQGRQVHGSRRCGAQRRRTAALTDADGQATATPGLAPLVLTADCLPIALIGDHAVAMLHAGWRGLAGGILEEGVAALRELGDDGPLAAAIGPGAGGCCYEVGPEVHAAFGRAAARPATLDLKAIARARSSPPPASSRSTTSALCTICVDPALFFSHRRDGGVTGRQAGVAWRS